MNTSKTHTHTHKLLQLLKIYPSSFIEICLTNKSCLCKVYSYLTYAFIMKLWHQARLHIHFSYLLLLNTKICCFVNCRYGRCPEFIHHITETNFCTTSLIPIPMILIVPVLVYHQSINICISFHMWNQVSSGNNCLHVTWFMIFFFQVC